MAWDQVNLKPFFMERGSRVFWRLAEESGLFSKALLLWSIVFFVDLIIYGALTLIVLPSQVARDYLIPDQLSLFQTVLGSYIIVIGIGYLILPLLKLLQNDMSEPLLALAILLACLNFVHVCHFFGGIFIIITPIFLVITVTNVSIFLSTRLGRFALFCSLVLYLGSIVLEKWGYLSAMSVVRETITVPQLFTNSTLIAVFAIILAAAMVIFESFVIYVVSLISERTRQTLNLNAQLEQSNKRLLEMDVMKDNFLSMVSHDLRTPLTGIMAYAEIIRARRDQLSLQEHDKFLGIIIEQSERLARLISDLLDVQRFETGKIKMDFTEVDLARLLSEAINAFRGAALEKNLTLTVTIPEQNVVIWGHHDRLHQAAANLLSNAVKFTPPGGLIDVSLKTTLDSGRPPSARVTVADNGPGIPAEQRVRIFEKFQQSDTLVRNPSQGSGLGLALTREIIQLHGGEVGLKSEPGQGSSFHFSLPLFKKDG